MEQQPGDKAIWADDHLGRKAEADYLETFLIARISEREDQGRSKSYVLNLNAEWGQGKSFFLERFAKQLRAHEYLVAEVNAWTDDHADDPLLPVMVAINSTLAKASSRAKLSPNLKKAGLELAVAGLKGAATQAANRYLGEEFTKQAKGSFDKIYDTAGKTLIEKFEKDQKSIKHFRSELAAALADDALERKPPLFVLIDELDRCRPTYAITLLERVKHIFEVDNVVFLVATNTDQLRHSISAVYGANFDSARYLNRFFDRTYQLYEQKELKLYIQNLFNQYRINESKLSCPPPSIVDYLVGGFNYFGLGLRDAAQCLDVLRSIITTWKFSFPLQLGLLFPLLVAQHRGLLVSLQDQTSTELEESARKSETKTWLIQFPPYHDRDGRHDTGATDGMKLFKNLSARAKKSIDDILSEENNSPSVRWMIEQFRAEAGSTKPYTRGSFSLLRNYADLVRTAGRLTDQKQNPPA